MKTFIKLVLFCLVMTGHMPLVYSVRYLHWLPNSNWDNTENWEDKQLPCPGDEVRIQTVLPQDVVTRPSLDVYVVTNTTMKKMTLPRRSKLLLSSNVRITFSTDTKEEDPECFNVSKGSWSKTFTIRAYDWNCAKHWRIGDTLTEIPTRPPCEEDVPVFLQNNAWVHISTKIKVQKLIYGGVFINTTKLLPVVDFIFSTAADLQICQNCSSSCDTVKDTCPVSTTQNTMRTTTENRFSTENPLTTANLVSVTTLNTQTKSSLVTKVTRINNNTTPAMLQGSTLEKSSYGPDGILTTNVRFDTSPFAISTAGISSKAPTTITTTAKNVSKMFTSPSAITTSRNVAIETTTNSPSPSEVLTKSAVTSDVTQTVNSSREATENSTEYTTSSISTNGILTTELDETRTSAHLVSSQTKIIGTTLSNSDTLSTEQVPTDKTIPGNITKGQTMSNVTSYIPTKVHTIKTFPPRISTTHTRSNASPSTTAETSYESLTTKRVDPLVSSDSLSTSSASKTTRGISTDIGITQSKPAAKTNSVFITPENLRKSTQMAASVSTESLSKTSTKTSTNTVVIKYSSSETLSTNDRVETTVSIASEMVTSPLASTISLKNESLPNGTLTTTGSNYTQTTEITQSDNSPSTESITIANPLRTITTMLPKEITTKTTTSKISQSSSASSERPLFTDIITHDAVSVFIRNITDGDTDKNKQDEQPDVGLIVGLVVGGALLIIIIAIVIYFSTRRNHPKTKSFGSKSSSPGGTLFSKPEYSTFIESPGQELASNVGFLEREKHVTICEDENGFAMETFLAEKSEVRGSKKTNNVNTENNEKTNGNVKLLEQALNQSQVRISGTIFVEPVNSVLPLSSFKHINAVTKSDNLISKSTTHVDSIETDQRAQIMFDTDC